MFFCILSSCGAGGIPLFTAPLRRQCLPFVFANVEIVCLSFASKSVASLEVVFALLETRLISISDQTNRFFEEMLKHLPRNVFSSTSPLPCVTGLLLAERRCSEVNVWAASQELSCSRQCARGTTDWTRRGCKSEHSVCLSIDFSGS